MALAKYLEDIVKRFHEDLDDFIADKEVDPTQQERRTAACRVALAQVQGQVERLLEMATDPEIKLADEVDYHRTRQTSLEMTVSHQARTIRELEARVEELQGTQTRSVRPSTDRDDPESGGVERRLRRLVQRAYKRDLTSDEFALVRQLQLTLGVTVREPALYLAALTHRSCRRPEATVVDDNRQLTTLGSRVLDLCLASLALLVQPDADTVAIHDVARAVVGVSPSAQRGRDLGLHNLLRVGNAVRDGDQITETMISDAYRALIGAIYLDLGFDACQRLVQRWYARQVDKLLLDHDRKRIEGTPQEMVSYKNQLQEITQGRRLGTPEYHLISKGGTEHSPEFVAEVRIGGQPWARGKGPSKRAAEHAAARIAIGKL